MYCATILWIFWNYKVETGCKNSFNKTRKGQRVERQEHFETQQAKCLIAGGREDHWHINWDLTKEETKRDEV